MDRIDIERALTSIIERLTESPLEDLAEHLSPHLRPGEKLPDLELVQRLMERLVSARREALSATEEPEEDTLIDGSDAFDSDDS